MHVLNHINAKVTVVNATESADILTALNNAVPAFFLRLI